jgi:hypothetical protein
MKALKAEYRPGKTRHRSHGMWSVAVLTLVCATVGSVLVVLLVNLGSTVG